RAHGAAPRADEPGSSPLRHCFQGPYHRPSMAHLAVRDRCTTCTALGLAYAPDILRRHAEHGPDDPHASQPVRRSHMVLGRNPADLRRGTVAGDFRFAYHRQTVLPAGSTARLLPAGPLCNLLAPASQHG